MGGQLQGEYGEGGGGGEDKRDQENYTTTSFLTVNK